MKERPILFNGPMVCALLDGTKTQTRRIVKIRSMDFAGGGPKDGPDWNDPSCWGYEDLNTCQQWALAKDKSVDYVFRCPYGAPADRLWVREAWMPGYNHEADHEDGPQVSVLYRADGECRTVAAPNYELAEQWELEYSEDGDPPPRWRPSIHMPRWASRIMLEIDGVRVERLNDCSDADALAEGVDRTNTSIAGYARERYQHLWESINGPGSWDANPWVWVVEFRRIMP